MKSIDVQEAKTHLLQLVAQAAKGESFVITKGGKPLVKVSALSSSDSRQTKRLGFLSGYISVPDDFDRMGSTEIEQLFGCA